MDKKDNLINHIFSYFSSNLIISILVIIFSFIIPRILGPDTYGVYKFLIFIPNVIITYIPEADFAMNRFIPFYVEHKPGSIIPMIRWNLKIKTISAIAGVIILLIYFSLAIPDYILYLIFLIPIFLLNFFTPTFSKILYGFKKVKRLNLISIFYQLIYFPIFIISYLFFGLIGAFIGISICLIFNFILNFYFGRKLLINLPKNNKDLNKRELFTYNFPYYIAKRINSIALTYASFFIVYKFGIGEEIGFYLLAILILDTIISLGKSVRTANFPLLTQKYEKNKEEYRKIILDSSRYSFLIVSVIALIFIIFGRFIFLNYLGIEYIYLIPLIDPIMIYLIFWSMINVFFDISLTQKKTWPNIISASLISSISIIFYILAPGDFGIYEILIIYLLAQVVGNIFIGVYGLIKSRLVLKNYLKLMGRMLICIITPVLIFLFNSIYFISSFYLYYSINSFAIVIFIILIFSLRIINKRDLKIFFKMFFKKEN